MQINAPAFAAQPLIRLLATDLDGTLVGSEETPTEYEAFARKVLDIRRRGGKWCIVTGRHLSALRPQLVEFYYMRLIPDMVVVEDARIFTLNHRLRAMPFLAWNAMVDVRRLLLHWRYRQALKALTAELAQRFEGAENMSRQGIDVWLKLPSTEVAVEAEELLHMRAALLPEYIVFRWNDEVCLAPGVGTKAEALHRLMRHFRIHPAEVMAIGDGANDIPMLAASVAGMRACVNNANDNVTRAVRETGGYVCTQQGLWGVLEAMDRFAGSSNDAAPQARGTDPSWLGSPTAL